MPTNLAAIRELVAAAFSGEELRTFCFDHFRPVYEQFAAGQSKTAMVLALVEHADRHGLLDKLLAEVKTANLHQYEQFEHRLTSSEDAVRHSPKNLPRQAAIQQPAPRRPRAGAGAAGRRLGRPAHACRRVRGVGRRGQDRAGEQVAGRAGGQRLPRRDARLRLVVLQPRALPRGGRRRPTRSSRRRCAGSATRSRTPAARGTRGSGWPSGCAASGRCWCWTGWSRCNTRRASWAAGCVTPAWRACCASWRGGNRGLCVVTTRLAADELADCEGATVRRVDLEMLSPEAGEALLRKLGVQGTAEELRAAATEVRRPRAGADAAGQLPGDGLSRRHPAAGEDRPAGGRTPAGRPCPPRDGVLRALVRGQARGGDPAADGPVRPAGRRGRDPGAAGAAGHRRADRDAGRLGARRLGLRGGCPARGPAAGCGGCVARACRPRRAGRPPAGARALRRAVAAVPMRPPGGRRTAGCTSTTKAGRPNCPDTLEAMAPLYAAVAHGCAAGHHQEALDEVYWRRIERGNEFYAVYQTWRVRCGSGRAGRLLRPALASAGRGAGRGMEGVRPESGWRRPARTWPASGGEGADAGQFGCLHCPEELDGSSKNRQQPQRARPGCRLPCPRRSAPPRRESNCPTAALTRLCTCIAVQPWPTLSTRSAGLTRPRPFSRRRSEMQAVRQRGNPLLYSGGGLPVLRSATGAGAGGGGGAPGWADDQDRLARTLGCSISPSTTSRWAGRT